jgi:hypothetical protein
LLSEPGFLIRYYKADIHGYVMVMQNISRELCRGARRADNRIAEVTCRRSQSRGWSSPR